MVRKIAIKSVGRSLPRERESGTLNVFIEPPL
jgi:hypothetical protein